MIGYIYKLYCDSLPEFYIGSTKNMNKRKINHKSRWNVQLPHNLNLKLYKYIRENNNFSDWKFEILETNEFESKIDRQIREQHYINLLNPTLNNIKSYLTKEELRIYKKLFNKKIREETNYICDCGSNSDNINKNRHNKTKKHQKYITNNITYNITNSSIFI